MQSTLRASGVSSGSCTVPRVLLSDGSGWLPENHSSVAGSAPAAGAVVRQASAPVSALRL